MKKRAKTMNKQDETDVSLRQAQKYCRWSVEQNPVHEPIQWINFDWEFGDTPVTKV